VGDYRAGYAPRTRAEASSAPTQKQGAFLKLPPQRAVAITVDGRPLAVPAGTTVAVALLNHGVARFRTAVGGEPRGPLCAMGTCFECRVTIDGTPHRRACLEVCAPGMAVETGR